MTLRGDESIKSKAEDTLNRFSFAEYVATGILNWKSNESFCIALHGLYGSGKSSLINLVIEAIKEKTSHLSPEEQPIIMRFQPWIFSGQERLIQMFLNELRKTLKKPYLSAHARKAAEHLETYEKILSFASW